jgi:hypothetical protein
MSLRNISLLLQSTQIAIQCHFRAEEVNDEFEKGEVVTQSINEVERHEAGISFNQNRGFCTQFTLAS